MQAVFVLIAIGLALAVTASPRVAASPEVPAVIKVELAADLAGLSLRQVEIIRLLLRAAAVIDDLYREQVTGEGFYPADMSRTEFEAWGDPAGVSPYTVVRRDASGALQAIPFHEAWPHELGHVARLLAQAGAITTDEALRNYLTQRARALITGEYPRA